MNVGQVKNVYVERKHVGTVGGGGLWGKRAGKSRSHKFTLRVPRDLHCSRTLLHYLCLRLPNLDSIENLTFEPKLRREITLDKMIVLCTYE